MAELNVNVLLRGTEDFSNASITEDDVDLQDIPLFTENEVNVALNVLSDGDYMWPQDEHYPEEVMLEVEVVSTWEDEAQERSVVELDNMSATSGSLSDYGSEAGNEHTSDMDLSQGSLDLSRTGPYYNQQTQHGSDSFHSNISQNSFEKVSNSSTPEQPSLPECLDLSRDRITSPRSRAYMHYSGGTSVELSPNSRGVLNPAFFQYQLPRIKLEPGLGIDPTITYKPEMDFNHNEPATSSPLPGTTAISYNSHSQSLIEQPNTVYTRLKTDEQLPNGCDNMSCDNMESPCVAVETLNANLNCIPLTVTSQDDDNDSGTESIDSKDSDPSNNLCITENGTSKKIFDKKRPGRKKGQVSKVYHLWEFIRDVLNDPIHCGKVIKWENEEEGIFRVVQSEVAATMWGQKKNNRTKMTYEKMSRSIRYSRKEGYFDDLPKDKGYPKKLCFKFGKKAHGWNTKRRQVPTTVPISKLDT